jgi:hypothetical protein
MLSIELDREVLRRRHRHVGNLEIHRDDIDAVFERADGLLVQARDGRRQIWLSNLLEGFPELHAAVAGWHAPEQIAAIRASRSREAPNARIQRYFEVEPNSQQFAREGG